MPHVASTLTADNVYVQYAQGGADMQIPAHEVLIKGGIGVANKMLITPTGATLTEVSDEDVAMLEKNPVFKKHMEGGFVKILNKKTDGEKVAADMITRDGSAPLSPAHFAEKADDPGILTVNSGTRA